MNDIIKHTEQNVLHFRRWSNTSYAIFNSIGRVVHIGFLSTIIQRLVTVKALIFHGLLHIDDGIIDNDECDEESINQLDTSGISLADLFLNLIAPSVVTRVEGFSLEFTSTIVYKNIDKACLGPFLFFKNLFLKSNSDCLFLKTKTNT